MIDLKAVAQTILVETGKQRTKQVLTPQDIGYLDGKADTAQLFLTYILRNETETNPMIKNELTFKRVRLSDIVKKRDLHTPSAFEQQLIDIAKDLQPGDGEQINPEKGLNYPNFNTRVSKMRQANKLANDITTTKDVHGHMYLVRLPAGETVKPGTRRPRKVA